MPKSIVIREQKFWNEYKNGEAFTDSLTDFTSNFTGLVMEKEKVRFLIDVSWGFEASTGNGITTGGANGRLSKTSGSFIDDGFTVGGTFDMTWTDNSGFNTLTAVTIGSISGNVMYVTPSTGTFPDSSTNGFVNSSVVLTGKEDLTSLIWNFGLVENSSSFSSQNLITYSDQSYYGSALNFVTWTNLLPLGQNKDWVTGNLKVRKVATGIYGVQQFEIEHEILIPYYADGDNFITPPSYLLGLNSLKYAFEASFRTVLSNPDSEKTFKYDISQGSVAYYDESYNGFSNDYSIISTTYENSLGVSADGVLTSEETTIRVTISKTSGSFVTTDKIGAYISLLPTVSDYTNTTTDFETNFMYSRLHCLANGTAVTQASSFIDSVSATVSAGNILLVIKTTLSTAQQIKIASLTTPNFALAIEAGDVTLSNGSSDRVMLLDTSTDIDGLIAFNSIDLFTHEMDSAVDVGFTSLSCWNEDGIEIKFDFDLDLNKDAFLNSLTIDLVAVENTTGNEFSLDSLEFQLGTTISSGVQQINFSDDRGYTLATGSNFNAISLTTGTQSEGLQNYIGSIGQKISWQDWVQNLNVDTIFYDSTKPNNNLNNKASNYANLINNYTIRIAFKSNLSGTNTTLGTTGLTSYTDYSGNINVYDYNKDALSPSERYTQVISTYTEDGITNLGGTILTNGDNTLVVTEWTDRVTPFTNFWEYYALHRLEPINSQGYAIEELSNIITPPLNQVIQPIVGSTLLDIAIVGGKLYTKSLVYGSNQNINLNYKLSSRLQYTNLYNQVKLIKFYVKNLVLDLPFDMTLTKSGVTSQFDYGDTTAIDVTNIGGHVYTVGSTYLCTINVFDYNSITQLVSNVNYIAGAFDWTSLLNVTNFQLKLAPELTSVLSPITSTVMTNFSVTYSGIATLDISGLTGLGGVFKANDNYSLKDLTLPSSGEAFSLFDVSKCSLINYFDLTPLIHITEINNVIIDFTDCSLSAASMNQFLTDIDSISSGFNTGRQILMAGTNSAPDTTSGGFNGAVAKANLISKSFSVITN